MSEDGASEDRVSEHFDVLIVGAGLSGIGSACHLQRRLPGKRYAILEGREAIGGTWDLFRYPGVRSDSDMFTLGYSFRPWTGARALAGGSEILSYVRDTARAYGIEQQIRFGHRVVCAEWDSGAARWTVTCELSGTGEMVVLTADFIHFCSGYYRYDEGYTPAFEGAERFQGTIVHPQKWPQDLDYTDKRVIVIGSGATAITLVPALAGSARHVTMLQRSPSYVISLPAHDAVAARLGRVLPPMLAYQIVRVKDISLTALSYGFCRRFPGIAKRLLRRGLERRLPPGYDIDRHFTPRYNPWDQRLCIAADGDLFRAIRAGTVSVVTDRITSFTESGVRLVSGEELEADIIITATGLVVELLGGARTVVDGAEVSVGDTVAYKGMMLSGVPNAALSVGYTNASWTLKCDLICEYVCRLIAHLDANGYDYCVPVEPGCEQARSPLLDFQSGYVQRALANLPRQGERAPWRLDQNWFVDRRTFLRDPLEDEGIRFVRAGERDADADAGQLVEAV